MTSKALVKNSNPPRGPLIEITVYTRCPDGVDPQNAVDHGITRNLVPIEGQWAVLMTNYRLMPGQEQEVWVHDFQFFVTREVAE